VATAKSFADYIGMGLSAPRTDTPSSVATPIVSPDPVTTVLNANQSAIVGYSRFLETEIQRMSLNAGVTPDEVSKSAGERLLGSMQGIAQHGEYAAIRVETFLSLRKAAGSPTPSTP